MEANHRETLLLSTNPNFSAGAQQSTKLWSVNSLQMKPRWLFEQV